MKKLHIALALAGAFAGTAQAQSAVEIYGIVDMGLVRDYGTVTGLKTGAGTQVSPTGNKVTSGAQSGTRLGFKGKEDLGNGLTGLFVLETGIAADTGGFNQGNTAFARQSFVGLQSEFGTLTLGRQYTSYFLALNQVADPFASGLAGNAQNLMLPPGPPALPTGVTADPVNFGYEPDRAIRMNNAIKYVTPVIANFTGELAYGFGENSAASNGGRVITGSIDYNLKPLNVRLAHYRKNNALDTTDISSTMLAASYDFGVAKAFAAFSENDWQTPLTAGAPAAYAPTGTKSRNYLIGVTVPVGPHNFIASYIHADGRGATSANDANQWALGYTYALSKRTNLYAAYGYIDNSGAATYTVGNNSENGTGNKAFNLGVRHLF